MTKGCASLQPANSQQSWPPHHVQLFAQAQQHKAAEEATEEAAEEVFRECGFRRLLAVKQHKAGLTLVG